MKNKESLKLKKEDLAVKYGDSIVMGVQADLVRPLLKNGYTPKEGLYITGEVNGNKTQIPLLIAINRQLEPKLRREAELDPNFKQVIVYTVIRYKDKVFCTHRLSGDERLAGSYSIGTGGHTDDGEDIYEAMYRELKEEVGITANHIMGYAVNGYILDDTTEVNKMHLGIVVSMVITTDEISCKEKDIMSGEWVDYKKLKKLRDKGELESWSDIIAENILGVK